MLLLAVFVAYFMSKCFFTEPGIILRSNLEEPIDSKTEEVNKNESNKK